MFFSTLGPAIAVHSAYREGGVSVSLIHNLRAPPGTVSSHQKQPLSPRWRHANRDCSPLPGPTLTCPSYL